MGLSTSGTALVNPPLKLTISEPLPLFTNKCPLNFIIKPNTFAWAFLNIHRNYMQLGGVIGFSLGGLLSLTNHTIFFFCRHRSRNFARTSGDEQFDHHGTTRWQISDHLCQEQWLGMLWAAVCARGWCALGRLMVLCTTFFEFFEFFDTWFYDLSRRWHGNGDAHEGALLV